MKDTKSSRYEDNKFNMPKEKQINDFIGLNLNQNAGKLINHSSGLINKFKNLNEELKEIIQLEKDIKMKEILSVSKELELQNFEKKLKDKNSP